MTKPLIEACNLTVSYNKRPAVHHLNFSVKPGTRLGIVGPNGSGKSTLLKAIEGLIPTTKANLKINQNHADIGSIGQYSAVDRSFPVTVEGLVRTGLFPRLGLWKNPSKDDLSKVQQSLSYFDLIPLMDRGISSLSGGQLQRALWARLMVQNPKLVLLDEAFNYLDSDHKVRAIDLIGQWSASGKTILIADHDKDLINSNLNQVLVLAREQMAFGSWEEVSPALIRIASDKHLDKIVPRPELCDLN